jgi:hypothetical protein
MRPTTRSRRTALSALLALLIGLVGSAALPSAASAVAPGLVRFTAVDGVIKAGDANGTGIVLPLSCTPAADPDLGSLTSFVAPDCDPSATPPSLKGTLGGDGSITVPEADISFPSADPAEFIPGLFVGMSIVPTQDASGDLDDVADTMTLGVDMNIHVVLSGLFTGVCDIPMSVNLAGPYDSATEHASISDKTFAIVIPAGACTGPSAATIQALIPTMLGNSASGKNKVRFEMDLTEVVESEPVVDDTTLTVASGATGTKTIPVEATPAATCALDGANGGAATGTATLAGTTITYNAPTGPATAEVDYTCTNTKGSDSGTLTVTVSAPATTTTTDPTTTTGGGTPTTAGGSSAATQHYLPSANSAATYSCTAADDATLAILKAADPNFTSAAVMPTIRMAGVSPSPAKGEVFNPKFSMLLSLPSDISDGLIALGVTQVTMTNMEWTITPKDGVTGSPLVAKPPASNIQIQAGKGVTGEVGPFSAPYTRTSEIGQPVAFTSGNLKLTIRVPFGGQNVDVNLACTATKGNVLTSTDLEGEPPASEVAGTVSEAAAAGGTLPNTGNDLQTTLIQLAAAALLLCAGYVLMAADPKRARAIAARARR